MIVYCKDMAPTTMRHLRVPDDVWAPAMERARREGTDLSKVVVTFLRDYVTAQPKTRRTAACKHPAARVHKGLCGACGTNVAAS